jgi:hypothetical protein
MCATVTIDVTLASLSANFRNFPAISREARCVRTVFAASTPSSTVPAPITAGAVAISQPVNGARAQSRTRSEQGYVVENAHADWNDRSSRTAMIVPRQFPDRSWNGRSGVPIGGCPASVPPLSRSRPLRFKLPLCRHGSYHFRLSRFLPRMVFLSPTRWIACHQSDWRHAAPGQRQGARTGPSFLGSCALATCQ